MTSVRSNLTHRRAVVGYVAGASVLAVLAALYLSSAEQRAAGSATPRTVVRTVWPRPSAAPTTSHAGKKAWPAPVKSTVVRTKSVLIGHPPNESGTEQNTVADGLRHCWDFRWQQDAQAAYLADLADPGGLDGLAGPHNGDGLACEQLPVDPSRPRSTPVDAARPTPTSRPTRDQVLAAKGSYFGASSDELPGSATAIDQLDSDVGKAPGLIEFFDTWDHAYAATGAKVRQTWNHGAMPVLTWMPEPKGGSNSSALPQYTLDHILGGDWDTYVYNWAQQVVQTGLPMGLRFAHEMNGSWYPWSAGLQRIVLSDGHTIVPLNNTPAKFIAAWRHVWQIFQDVGANRYTVWIWTPVTSLCTTSGTCGSYTTYAEDYPGDAYVDWIGLSSYAYGSTSKYTFAGTFARSFANLAAVSTKPVFVAETAAAERVTTPGTAPRTFATAESRTALKVQWTQQALAGFLEQGTPGVDNFLNAGQRVIGFVLFDNYVPNVHSVNGIRSETDWRWNSSPQAAAAFRTAIADKRYLGGTMPAHRMTVFPDPDAARWPVVPPSASSSAPGSPTTGTPTTGAPTTGAPTTGSPATGSASPTPGPSPSPGATTSPGSSPSTGSPPTTGTDSIPAVI